MTVKKQLSQLFRNLRRRSEELKPAAATHVAINYARPAASCFKAGKPAGDDNISYERNTRDLQVEIHRKFPRPHLVQMLLKATHTQRRKRIEESVQKAHSILEEYPFLRDPRWVMNNYSMRFKYMTHYRYTCLLSHLLSLR